ncbi:transglutaminase TgpA family protein [Nocardiopsis ansamitocini]|uniref:transglutaminase TgpA family protein n=1 Tax=Nocardiopsis ansamitocini TaxID=1670832 RepID=UPI002555F1AB|nr:DUF3488 and transglutaminase-like domain-containing protein [Nocardiopsis ansamitocini]
MALPLAAMVTTLCAFSMLDPVFATSGWWYGSALAVLVVTGIGVALSWSRVPAILVPLAQIVGVACTVTAVYAPESAILGFLPTAASFSALSDLIALGFGDIRMNISPVPVSAGLLVVMTASLGGLGVLVHLVAVQLRLAGLAGMALLALVFVPLTVHHEGVTWSAFALTALGFLLLLAVEGSERSAGWGLRVPPSAEAKNTWASRTGSYLRQLLTTAHIAVVAVVLALLVPLAVPGMVNDAVFALASGARDGGQTVTTVNPLASLRRDITSLGDRRILEYRTSQSRPDYLRMHVLDTFDGENWTMSPVEASQRNRVDDQDLPEPDGFVTPAPDQLATTQVTVSSGTQRMDFLPLPYPTRNLAISGDWFTDPETLMVFSPRGEARGLTYEAVSAAPEPSSAALARTSATGARTVDSRYLDLPDGVDPRVRELAESITGDASSTHARAVALQNWFTSGDRFDYDLSPEPVPEGADPLAHFLFEDRVGYCQQFSAAMAVMARQLGIPARVAVGYTSGTSVSADRWIVTERNAHAWPELYFEGAGWLRFEPTPSSTDAQPSATVPGYAYPAEPDTSSPEGPGSAAQPEDSEGAGTDSESGETSAPVPGGNLADDFGGGTVVEESFPWTGVLIGIGAVAALLLLPALIRGAVRRVRWGRARDALGRSRAAWLELRDDLVDLGVEWRPAESPRGLGRRLENEYRLGSHAKESLRRIVAAEEAARYAPDPLEGRGLGSDGRTVRLALGALQSTRARITAVLLPRSLYTSRRF